jgi:hypothetical protein
VLGGIPLLAYVLYQKLRHKTLFRMRALDEQGCSLARRDISFTVSPPLSLGFSSLWWVFVVWSRVLVPFTGKERLSARSSEWA